MIPGGTPSLESGTASLAAALPRLVAFGVDAVLALLAAALLRFAVGHGDLRLLGSQPGILGSLLRESSTWLLVLLLAALRDVPTGESIGKWLLGLRVVTPAGTRLPFSLRIARAPFSLLPLEWLAGEKRAHVPWRVSAYVPGRAGLLVRVALALAAASCSLLWGVAGSRPSISRADAVALVESTLARDPALRRTLGEPLQIEVATVTPRSRAGISGARCQFTLRIRGTARRQEMVVRALKIEGRWAIDEVVDIRESRLAGGGSADTLPVR